MPSAIFLESLVRDLRHGLRALRRNPVFTVVALLTLAIGIGANTAVFSVVNSVLLKPLPYPNSEQLVSIWHSAPGAAGLVSVSGDLRFSRSMYVTYAEQNHAFQSIGIWYAGTMTITGLAEPEQVRSVFVSDGALQALAVPPVVGRWLSQADTLPNAPRAIMLNYGYWQRRFGGDRSVIGRNITVDSLPREIVGIMPQGFRIVDADSELISPLLIDRNKLILPGFGFQCVARLKPGVTITAANADIARLIPIWMNSWPADPGGDPHAYENWKIAPSIRSLKQEVVGSVQSVLWVVMAMIGVVMLIAAANVANLLLVRAEARQHELALRAALGARWGQLVRTLLVESVLLACMGGALGLYLAYEGLQLLLAVGPGNLPRLAEISIDAQALAFTLAASLLSGLLIGLFPALKSAGSRATTALRGAGRTLTQSRERHRARSILVVAQVAMALVLLVGSGLMIRTFISLRHVEPGFTHPGQIQVARVSIPTSMIKEPERVIRMQNDIVDKLSAIQGVTSVAFASEMPMEGVPVDWDIIVAEGRTYRPSEIPPVRTFKTVSPGLFRTLGTRILAGRDYSWTDFYGRRPYAIVSENLAHELWGSPSAAIGKRISTGLPSSPWREVIGVIENLRDNGVQEAAPSIVYWPSFGQDIYTADRYNVNRIVTFAIRSDRAGTLSFMNDIEKSVWSVNPSLPLASVSTLLDFYSKSLARTSFALVMLAIAGTMALFLGIIGIYGVISYTVSQRKREIGIRMALGAQRSHLKQMFVRNALTLTAIGVAIGLATSAAMMGLLRSLLYGISPLDPLTYIAVPLVLTTAAALASYLPARRAANMHPVEALKSD